MRGFTPEADRPEELEGLLRRVADQGGYHYEKNRPSGNFTFSPERAAQFAINSKEPDVFIIRVGDSRAIGNHRHDMSMGFEKEDFWLSGLEWGEMKALVVPPGTEDFSVEYLAGEGLAESGKKVVSPPKWPRKKQENSVEQLVKDRRKVLAEFLSRL